MRQVCILTLGCKINQFESSALAEQFELMGYQPTDDQSSADIIIINTCTVTNRTDFKSRNLIRKALQHKLSNPHVKVFVTGCYAQRDRQDILALGDLDGVIDNQNKTHPLFWFENSAYQFQDIFSADCFSFTPVSKMYERTRAFLKVQDGCNFFCHYCAVPYARGKSRSSKLSDVLSQVQSLCKNSYQEIVLGGINLGLYRDPETDTDLAGLLRIIHQEESLKLIRLSSIEPQLFSPTLLEALSSLPKICPHLHIPLQSGSDSVLNRMGRNYSTREVSSLVKTLKAHNPYLAIGMDVITGFPGETEAEFSETVSFLSSLKPSYLHVFSYSKRHGTPAASFPQQVHGNVIAQRTSFLSSLGYQFKKEYALMLIKEQIPLRGIIEKENRGIATALSDHYLRINIETTDPPIRLNTLVNALPQALLPDAVQAQVARSSDRL